MHILYTYVNIAHIDNDILVSQYPARARWCRFGQEDWKGRVHCCRECHTRATYIHNTDGEQTKYTIKCRGLYSLLEI